MLDLCRTVFVNCTLVFSVLCTNIVQKSTVRLNSIGTSVSLSICLDNLNPILPDITVRLDLELIFLSLNDLWHDILHISRHLLSHSILTYHTYNMRSLHKHIIMNHRPGSVPVSGAGSKDKGLLFLVFLNPEVISQWFKLHKFNIVSIDITYLFSFTSDALYCTLSVILASKIANRSYEMSNLLFM